MKDYSTFIFDSYIFDETSGQIELMYNLDNDVTFKETIVLPQNKNFAITDRDALERALFMLHLIGGMSYYKTCLPKNIEIHSGILTKEQATFWNTVYTQGLGEFFFQNNIDFRNLVDFPSEEAAEKPNVFAAKRKTNVLTPIGGGKDSIVTIELLKKAKVPQALMRVGQHPFIDEVVHVTGLPAINIERRLSNELFKMNSAGALNGHVPITAYLSMLNVVLAEIYGYSHVVFSNERSADEGNTEMHGMEINHQWSKSIEFEKAFREYLSTYVTKNVEYFSMLRPLSELHIVQLFTEYPQYFEHFTSCNDNWKILKDPKLKATDGRWCGKCPKCAFAFAMLAAFLPKETVLKIFGNKNMFADAAMVPHYKELLGVEGIKPFECVGTPEETFAALSLADETGSWEGTPVIGMFQEEEMQMNLEPEDAVNAALKPSMQYCVPSEFQKLLPL